MTRWVVDGMNVIGSRPDGWWHDRDRAARRLVGNLQRWRRECEQPVLVVLDGHPNDVLPAGTHDGVHVLYASSSAPDAADDRIAELVAGHWDPASLTVVTSDTDLAGRVRAHGAAVEGAGTFLRRIGA